MDEKLKVLWDFVQKQAEDKALWAPALYASEAYIQSALRELHDKIEVAYGEITGPLEGV